MPIATRSTNERGTTALGIRPSACRPSRPVSGWGQGRQPPAAVARSASLEASRSQGYFKIQLLPGDEFVLSPSPADSRFLKPGRARLTSADLTPATGARTTRFCRPLAAPLVLRDPDHSRAEARPAINSARPALPRPPHPIPTSVTIAIRPSCGTGWRKRTTVSGFRKEIFRVRTDNPNQLESAHEISF